MQMIRLGKKTPVLRDRDLTECIDIVYLSADIDILSFYIDSIVPAGTDDNHRLSKRSRKLLHLLLARNATNTGGTSAWSCIWSFATASLQTIPLAAGWGMKSLNVHPLDSSMSAVFDTNITIFCLSMISRVMFTVPCLELPV